MILNSILKLRKAIGQLAPLCLFALNPGCGTWIGNPGPDKGTDKKSIVQLSIQSFDSSLSVADNLKIPVNSALGVSDGFLTISEAYVALKEIKLKTAVGSTESAGEFKGPYVVDLISNKTSPSLDTIEIASTKYQDIELKLEKLETEKFSGTLPSANIANNSIYMSGIYTNALGTKKSFKMAFSLSEEFKLSTSRINTREISLEEGNNSLILAFRPTVWFAFNNKKSNESKIDFSSLSDSSIDLNKDSKDSSQKLLEIIKENIKQSARFGKDSNSDGSLNSDEDDDL